MKIIRLFLLFSLPLLILAACAAKPAATVQPAVPQVTAVVSTKVVLPTVAAPVLADTSVPATVAAEPTATASAVNLTDAEMEALIFEKVHDKHTVEFILSQNKTAAQWSSTLDKMIGFGAKITPEEKTLIINWLVGRKK